MERQAVFLRVDGHGAKAEFVGGAKNADGDFAAVGGEEFANGTRFFTMRNFTFFSRIQAQGEEKFGWGKGDFFMA